MQQKSTKERFGAWGLLIFLGLIWGSSYILMKKGVQVFLASEVAGLRIFSAAVFLLPWSLSRLRQLSWLHYRRLLLTGSFGALIPAFLSAKAQTQLDSGLSGALNALMPIFALLVSSVWFRQPIVKNELRGALLGLTGTLLLIFFNAGHSVGGVNYYAFFILLVCFLYGLNANLVKHYLKDLDAAAIISISFLMIGIIAGALLFTQTAFLHKLQTVENAYSAMGHILLLGVLGTAIGQLLFVGLVKRVSPVFASMVCFISPVVALGWGLLDGEVLVWGQYLGIATILAGVYLVNKRNKF